MTDEKIESIKHIPIWFVHSADDTVVVPAGYSVPTYRALLDAGAENVHYSYFENVHGVDDPETQFWGHWVWVYLFNDQVTAVQEAKNLVPSNNGGGSLKARDSKGEYNSIFAWLNAQVK